MISLLPITLVDNTNERVRRNHAEAIVELQKGPCASTRILTDVELQDGVTTKIPHTLGRKPLMTIVSPARGAVSSGRIEEVRDGSYDRGQYIALKATGWGATITVDIEVK